MTSQNMRFTFKDGEFTREFFDSDHYDDVMGYVNKEQILSLISKIQKIMIPKYEDLTPKQQGFISGVGITLLSVT